MKLSTAVASILVLASWIPFGSAYPNPSDTVRVNVPAGPLVDAVELLARQAGINVMYQGDVLRGQSTTGLSGSFAPRDAFARLLEGTSLVATLRNEGVLIAAAQKPQRSGAEVALPSVGSPGPGPAAASPDSTNSVCHRVSENAAIAVYCGKPEQWTDLKARVGFSCRKVGKDELCASAKEWNRRDLTESTKQEALRQSVIESNQRAEGGRMNIQVTPTVSAPVQSAPTGAGKP